MNWDEDDVDVQDWEEPDDGVAELVVCPSCGRDVYEETQQCPYCGDWIVAGRSSKNRLWVVAGILALIGMLVWVIR